MRFIICFFLLLTLSCHNTDDELVLDLVKSNNELLKIAYRSIDDDYFYRMEDEHKEIKDRIKNWQRKGEKIDSLYETIYNSDTLLPNNYPALISMNSRLNNEVFRILKSNIEDIQKIKLINHDSFDLLKNDSLTLALIYHSSYSDSIKDILYKNYFRNKSINYQTYSSSSSPHFLRCFPHWRYGSISVIDKYIVLPGEPLNVFAAIGDFTYKTDQKIYINNKLVDIDQDNIANMKFKASSILGKHRIPVKIVFENDDGNIITETSDIEYEVVDTICR